MLDIFLFILIGLCAGLLAGMLGLGGGIIIVPGMVEWLTYKEMATDRIMQLSVGTSLSTVVIISLITGLMHRRLGYVVWDIVRFIAPGTTFGAVFGVLIADHLSSDVLQRVFALLLCAIALQLLFFPHRPKSSQPILHSWQLTVCGIFIGALAGMLGIGGGIILIPLLIYNGTPIIQASATSLWCVLPMVLVASCVSIWTGYNEVGLPTNSLGYVYWPATLIIGACALISSPIGIHFALKMSKIWLQRIFAVVLLIITIRMLVG
ncbi:MAG TPA: sulfite exporter TauE/SafE family protein [Gammaproteobacteria bacterium]|nr:sulfite exporter TauE/SafE family protein [Gammaproteobacteria bacterium]